ncbi:MAG: carbon starvation protein A [Verrucomicrobiae bacterium]|nr:carbon starvation protein A [Verrucomicrobiae bacterium]
MRKAWSVLLWTAVTALGGLAYSIVAFRRGEPLNAIWILAAALCTFAIAYRFYSKWIAAKLLVLDERRATPCEVHEDGREFCRTNKWIVFGHHFAAISGPGPLVGPVLAAQFGYLPGALWILIGVALGGAVQDFLILFCSIRRDGRSLGEMVRDEIGPFSGWIALLAIISILIILVAVLSLIVVKALADSPWGTFTIAATIPIAMMMGCFLRYVRPGKVLEVSAVGVALLLFSVWAGGWIHDSPQWASWFTCTAKTLAGSIIGYGLAASILPVWLLLAPRDYLSTFMKLGTIAALAIGIFIVLPPLQLPALTHFPGGKAPVFSGSIFPFCFITIACGAISGFHSLIASGTTPKIISRETHARPVGYGSMLLESFVAIMALIAACTLQPGVYFAMNSQGTLVGSTPESAAAAISAWGYSLSPEDLEGIAREIGEKTVVGRSGGAPTLAVGMAHIFSQIVSGPRAMALWYHFAIMFEALFILTTVDAGTRVGRFLLQAFLGQIWEPLGRLKSIRANVLASVLFVGAWGSFLYQGVVDPQGGINSLWPLFGIANQLLAVVALCLGTTVLIKMGRGRFAWVTLVPLLWLTIVTFTAGAQKIGHSDPAIGFLAKAHVESAKLENGSTPEEKAAVARQVIRNQKLDAAVAGVFLALVAAILASSAWRWIGLISGRSPLDLKEAPARYLKGVSLPGGSSPGAVTAALLLGLGLLRQWTGQPAAPGPKLSIADGRQWAREQEERFQKPRCC